MKAIVVVTFIIASFIAMASLGTSSIIGYHEEVCNAGEKFSLEFTIVNDHPYPMNDTIIKLNITSYDGKSTSINAPHFLYSGSMTMNYSLGDIDDYRNFATEIQTYKDSPTGEYTVNVNLSFNDLNGIRMYEEEDLKFMVKTLPKPPTPGSISSKASKIMNITKTPQIKPGKEGKLEFNITNPYPYKMTNVDLTAEIYYYVEYSWFTERKSCEIGDVEHPPKFEDSTNTTIHLDEILSNETNSTSLSIISTKDTNQGTYFIRFCLEFDYNDARYEMKSRGYFTDEEWDNATSNASGCFGGINILMLGVDGIIPETSFGVKKPIPLWPLYLLIAVTACLGIVAVGSYVKSEKEPVEVEQVKKIKMRGIGKIESNLIIELDKELEATEKEIDGLKKERPRRYKERIEKLEMKKENIRDELKKLEKA